jgi:hypothetical protein
MASLTSQPSELAPLNRLRSGFSQTELLVCPFHSTTAQIVERRVGGNPVDSDRWGRLRLAPNGMAAFLAATPPTSSLLEIASLFLGETRWTVPLQKRPYLGMAAHTRMACSVQPAFQGVG